MLIMFRVTHENTFGEILMKMDRRMTLLEDLLQFEKEDRKVSLQLVSKETNTASKETFYLSLEAKQKSQIGLG